MDQRESGFDVDKVQFARSRVLETLHQTGRLLKRGQIFQEEIKIFRWVNICRDILTQTGRASARAMIPTTIWRITKRLW